jgi:hypothetical protein
MRESATDEHERPERSLQIIGGERLFFIAAVSAAAFKRAVMNAWPDPMRGIKRHAATRNHVASTLEKKGSKA